jgi:hypothetical protein
MSDAPKQRDERPRPPAEKVPGCDWQWVPGWGWAAKPRSYVPRDKVKAIRAMTGVSAPPRVGPQAPKNRVAEARASLPPYVLRQMAEDAIREKKVAGPPEAVVYALRIAKATSKAKQFVPATPAPELETKRYPLHGSVHHESSDRSFASGIRLLEAAALRPKRTVGQLSAKEPKVSEQRDIKHKPEIGKKDVRNIPVAISEGCDSWGHDPVWSYATVRIVQPDGTARLEKTAWGIDAYEQRVRHASQGTKRKHSRLTAAGEERQRRCERYGEEFIPLEGIDTIYGKLTDRGKKRAQRCRKRKEEFVPVEGEDEDIIYPPEPIRKFINEAWLNTLCERFWFETKVLPQTKEAIAAQPGRDGPIPGLNNQTEASEPIMGKPWAPEVEDKEHESSRDDD